MKNEILPEKTRIGWVGTGVMGKSMCGHILKKGYDVTVYNRTKAKVEELLSLGATWAKSPALVARDSEVTFSMVGYPRDVREIYLGEDGILSTAKDDSIIVDMTTSQPSLAIEIYNKAKERGISAIDAPVSGGDIGAREARLSIMIGGDKEIAETIHPLLQLMGTNIRYMGPAGAGQNTKMSNQILIASTMIGVVECLMYAYKSGLNLEEVIAAIGSGAAGCWSINNLGPRIIKRDFDPGFFVEHFVKDMEIALDEARRMNLSMPGLALAHQFYVSLKAKNRGRLGTQALALAFEEMNATTMEKH